MEIQWLSRLPISITFLTFSAEQWKAWWHTDGAWHFPIKYCFFIICPTERGMKKWETFVKSHRINWIEMSNPVRELLTLLDSFTMIYWLAFASVRSEKAFCADDMQIKSDWIDISDWPSARILVFPSFTATQASSWCFIKWKPRPQIQKAKRAPQHEEAGERNHSKL